MNKADLTGLCSKLGDLLRHEINAGNKIIAVETGWSKVSLAVRLANPLDMEYVKMVSRDDPDLELWESHDIKNPVEAGVLCKSARQTLSGSAGSDNR